jgi:tetratricopeptide (TPR) repeat protein
LHFQPESVEARFALASVYKARGMQRNERQELDEVLRLKPAMLAARLALADYFIRANDGKSALALLSRAPGDQQHTLGVVTRRNWALFATGDTTTLRAELDAELKTARHAELLLQNAALKMSQRDYPGARADAEEVLKSRPDDVRAAELVFDGYLAQKQPARAMERLKQIAESQPKSAPLHLLLGRSYAAAANLAEARNAYEAAKSADPKFVTADLALAELDQRENLVDSARQRLTAIIRANPGNVPALLQLAYLDDASGRRADAIATYRSVLDADRSNLSALNNLAYNLAIDKPDEALKFAQQAVEIVPDNPTVQDTLGWVYFRKGLYRSALGYLKNAFASQPTPRRQFHLAMCYFKSGNQDQGQKNMQAALLKDPDLENKEQGW